MELYLKRVFFLKNMVSNSCLRLVKSFVDTNKSILINKLELGKLTIEILEMDDWNEVEFETKLKELGFSILIDKNQQLVEQIKIASVELIHLCNNANSLIRNSDYLTEKLGIPYHQLSKIFSEKTGTTLERYIILLKIEKVKELLSYDEYSVSEISFMMGYSSVQYLSNQFKLVTGFSVSEYKRQEFFSRIPLEVLI